MTKVQIREDPARADIREQAASLAAELREEPGVQVDVVDGRPGELSVNVDGREVAHKEGDAWRLPLNRVGQSREQAASLAAELRKEPGVQVDVVGDQPGELEIRDLTAKEMTEVEGGIHPVAFAFKAIKAVVLIGRLFRWWR